MTLECCCVVVAHTAVLHVHQHHRGTQACAGLEHLRLEASGVGVQPQLLAAGGCGAPTGLPLDTFIFMVARL